MGEPGKEFLFPQISDIRFSKIDPEHTFHDFASCFSNREGTVLLQSGGEGSGIRYNILAAYPRIIITAKEGRVQIKGKEKNFSFSADPFNFLEKAASFYSSNYPAAAGLPFQPGLFGYLSYDLKNHIEKLPAETMDDLRLPDLYMVLPELVVFQDLETTETTAVHIIFEDSDIHALSRRENELDDAAGTKYSVSGNPYYSGPIESNFSKEEYIKTVSSIIEYIRAGDIYQVNMSQRFTAPFSGNGYSLYFELFEENPAAFFAFLNCGDHSIVSTSPERFIKQEGNRIEARPIKGTRPRGRNREEDEALKKDLLESEKDDAELSMIVDLLRNDIGKVSRAGSVRVTAHKNLESYKNVHHLVSFVEGELEEGKTSVDLIKAAFPGGSITGCPKIRAMEIIEEKEPFRRHIYTGSIGYIGFNGTMDLSIAIRTAVVSRDRIYFSAGGGIVYDSVPEDEYFETLHKADSFTKILSRHHPLLQKKRFLWQNGKIIEEKDAALPVSTAAVQYGRSVFETILVQKGEIKNLQKHLDRLEKSCRVILKANLPKLSFRKVIMDIIIENSLGNGDTRVKILVSRGNRDKYSETLSITVTAEKYINRLEKTGRKGFRLGIFPYQRGNFLFNHKTGNYLFNLLAGEWAAENGFDEAVILNPDGSVSETNTGNILIIKSNRVIRPKSDYVLPGIKEMEILEEYRQKGYKITERTLTPEELAENPVYVTNSLIGMVPVISVSLKEE